MQNIFKQKGFSALVPLFLFVLSFIIGFLITLLHFNSLGYLENIWRCLIFFSVGVQALLAFYIQIFHGKDFAQKLGWAFSPFLFEVGVSNLGNGVAAILSPFFGAHYLIALSISTSIFSLGAAFGHIRDIFQNKNFSVFSAGPILYSDIFVPVVIWLIIIALHI